MTTATALRHGLIDRRNGQIPALSEGFGFGLTVGRLPSFGAPSFVSGATGSDE